MTHNANRERNNPGTTPEVQRSEQQAQRTFEEVRNTASQVASDVQNTAQRAISNATQKFDFKEQIGQRPLLILGGALAVGYWLGKINTGGRQEYGHHQVAQLFQQTLDEEEQTDRQLTQIAERGINTRAAQT